MAEEKVRAACTEVRTLLMRLSIPTFRAHMFADGSDSGTDGCAFCSNIGSARDVERLIDSFPSGGTDMMSALRHVMLRDAPELVLMLTDAQCGWDDRALSGVPVVVGGIDRADGESAKRYLPQWTKFVNVGNKDGSIV